MAQNKATFANKLPDVRDVERVDAQWSFDGAWLPDLDPAKIGPNNYRTLKNMRYTDGGPVSVPGYTKVNTTAIATYTNVRTGHQLRSDRTQKTYVMVQAQDTSGNGRVYQNQTTIPSQGDFAGTQLHTDSSTNLEGRFSDAPGGNVAYCNGEETCIWGGEEMRVSGFYTVDGNHAAGHANPIDYTEQANNILTSSGNTIAITATQRVFVVFTTRPAQGFNFTISAANASASTLACKYWDGTDMTTAVANESDGTASGGVALAQTGSYTFDSLVGSVKPFHFQGLYLYAYEFTLSDGTATISHVSADIPWQNTVDVWDGVYRQPIQVQLNNNSLGKYEDFTLQVNDSSTVDTPIGAILDESQAADTLYIMFEDRVSAIKCIMLAGLVNTNAAVTTVKYWDGNSFEAVSGFNDGTSNGGDTFGQTGLISWSPPAETSEQPREMFGTTGYVYEITHTNTFSGTDGGTEEVLVDIIMGIPAQKTMKPYKFPVMYKNRLMLCGYTQGKEGNRIDYSLTNGADVFNGDETSNDGVYSLYFGNSDELTAATTIFNRFGANIYSTLLVLKQNETYLLTGDGPDDFSIYPVSYNVGCPAPKTLVTAEAGYEMAQDVVRNVAIWLSYSGPVLFDGAILRPLLGINKFFDLTDDDCLNHSSVEEAAGWYDPTYKEYHLVIPTGSSTTNDRWLVYDLVRKKWYERNPSPAPVPQCGIPVRDTDGTNYIYLGTNTGLLERLDNGSTWDGEPITSEIAVGDFWPDKSIWHKTIIRYLKVVAKRITEDHTLTVKYYDDTNEDSGVGVVPEDLSPGVTFTDQSPGVSWATTNVTTLNLTLSSGLKRLVRTTDPMNSTSWAHGFGFSVTTSTTEKPFQPIAWGIQYEYVRDDT